MVQTEFEDGGAGFRQFAHLDAAAAIPCTTVYREYSVSRPEERSYETVLDSPRLINRNVSDRWPFEKSEMFYRLRSKLRVPI